MCLLHINSCLCRQNANPNQFSLVEVMLDKGVSERELGDDEKPWLIMQRNRRVCCYFLSTESFLIVFYYTVRYKNTPKFINRNLKMDDQILIIFGTNILDTTGYQVIVYFFTSLNVCFCTTWEKQNRQNITFSFINTYRFRVLH